MAVSELSMQINLNNLWIMLSEKNIDYQLEKEIAVKVGQIQNRRYLPKSKY